MDARCVCRVDVSDISRRFTLRNLSIDSNFARFLVRKNDNGPLISAGHWPFCKLDFYRRLVLEPIAAWHLLLVAGSISQQDCQSAALRISMSVLYCSNAKIISMKTW
jgi:hypothetical protein